VKERLWVIGGVIVTGKDRSKNRKTCKKYPTNTAHEVAWDRTVASRAEDQHLSV